MAYHSGFFIERDLVFDRWYVKDPLCVDRVLILCLCFNISLNFLFWQHNSIQTTPIKQQPTDRRQILKPLHQPLISQPRIITIARGNTGLGMSLACDAETDSIVVKNILSGSAVGRDGRIRIGDCIIAINHESLEGVSLSQAK